jgi:hypothetical protein
MIANFWQAHHRLFLQVRRFDGVIRLRLGEAAKLTFYGLRAYLRVCWPGVICGMSLALANIHELRLQRGCSKE